MKGGFFVQKIPAVAYCRYSSDNQREESIEAQVRALTEFANRSNYEIIKVYSDEAKTATTDQRPAFLQMMKDAELGQFKAVLVHKLDRFSRDRYDSAFYKRHLKKYGIRLVSALENLDDSPESVILESILEGMAEYYSKNLSREVMKGLKENAYSCRHTGGIPPLGYDVAPDMTYIINEEEAEIVRYIFEQHASGVGYGIIVDNLNAMNKRTKARNPFKVNSIRDILKNEKYTGVYIFNRRASGKKGNYVNKPESEIIRVEGGMPQIVDQSIFNQVNMKMDIRIKGKRANAKTDYLLTGFLTCGSCGGPYTGKGYVNGRGGKKYYVYGCTNRYNGGSCKNKNIRQTLIEDHVIGVILETMLTDNGIDSFADRVVALYNSNIENSDSKISELEAEIDKVKVKLDRLLNLYLDGDLDQNAYNEKSEALKSSHSELVRIMGIQSKQTQSTITKEVVVKYLSDLRVKLTSESSIDRKAAIATVVKEVIIEEDVFRVDLIIDDMDSG